jgi:L-iditol 2-dehydrogenase
MIAAVYRGGGQLVAEEWPRPAIGEGEVLLRLLGCGLCGSDIAKIGDPTTPAPVVLGHEVVGEVVALGAGVTDCAIGDRVVAAHHVPCGACHYCRRGSESMCRAFKASNLDPGGFAEYVRVPATNARHAMFRVPRHVSDEAASFVEPLACCLRSVRRARVEPGDTIVVVGLGSIGCLFVQILQRAGGAVVGCDPIAERAAIARRLGAAAAGPAEAATAAQRELRERQPDERRVDVQRLGDARADAGGDALPLRLETLYHRELTLAATYSSSPADLAAAFRLIVAGAIAVDPLVTHRVSLEGLHRGVDLMRRREALKVYVTP